MEIKILETVMNELLKEQKDSNRLLEELIGHEKATREKVSGFDDRLKQIRIVPPVVDTKPLTNLMAGFFEKVKQIMESQPKNVIHQRRFLLFPEDNTGYYYKIIFGRLIPWGIVLIVGSYCFSIGDHYVDGLKEEAKRRYYFEAYQDAWNRLDSTIGPVGRRKMDEALKAAVNNSCIK
jgi:hypothetical protein